MASFFFKYLSNYFIKIINNQKDLIMKFIIYLIIIFIVFFWERFVFIDKQYYKHNIILVPIKSSIKVRNYKL